MNRVLALLAALALVAFAVLFTIEVFAAAAGAAPVVIHWRQIYTDGLHNVWRSTGPITISVILVVIGLLLVLAELKPRRVTDLPLTQEQAGVSSAITTRGLRVALTAAATSVDGVASAKVRVRRSHGKITATTLGSTRDHATQLQPQVAQAVHERLEQVSLQHQVQTKVTVSPGKAST